MWLFRDARHFTCSTTHARYISANKRGTIKGESAMALNIAALKTRRFPRYDAVAARANELTRPYSTPPIPVLEIAEKTGVDVVFADMGQHRDKVAGFCDFRAAKLYVNVDDPTNRQTFTIAHELGHWVLHRDVFINDPDRYPVLPRFQSVDTSDIYEREANSFAGHLLVPGRLLKPISDHSVAVLARIFAVSASMMENRLKYA